MVEHQVGRRFRVGLVVLVALVGVMGGIFMVGQRANLFKSKLPYVTRFESASGLVAGNPVRLNGVTVGNVLEVVLSPDPADRTVKVIYNVDRRAAPRLRKGTHASIKTIGLLGDKYIELEGGRADEPEVPVEGDIPATPGGGIDKLLEGGGDLLPDLSAVASSLKNILGRTEKGEGFLGAITSNSAESKKLGNNLNDTLHSLNAMIKKIEGGSGLAGKLFFDDKYGKETTASLAGAIRSVQSVFARLDEGMKSNSSLISALISDPEGKKKVYGLVDNLSAAAVSLAKVAKNLETGEGALPLLLRDEQFGRAFTQNLKSFSERLDSIGRKLDEGHGTAGKLINDPAIFDAANRLVVGIDQSSLLRWLVKDRQKAAIRKEYNDAQKAARTPTPTPTPPPGAKPTS
jgi:phospholipid/cholesterol/gamma-HCH transport system substrate-binding protein